jgi:GTPase SAR1 family protein
MPFPLIIIPPGGVIGGVVALVAYINRKKIFGRKIGILGLPQSGKTTLAYYLIHDELPQKVETTIKTEEHKSEKLEKLADLGIEVLIDARSHHQFMGPGKNRMTYAPEDKILKECDIVLYLFDASKCFNAPKSEEDLRTIKKEIKLYSALLEQNKKKIIFLLIGTHSDNLEKTADSNLELQIVNLLEAMPDVCKTKYLGLNSLKDERKAKDLKEKIFDVWNTL